MDSDGRCDSRIINTVVITVAPPAPDISPPGVQSGGAPGPRPVVDGGACRVVPPSEEEGEHAAGLPLRAPDCVAAPLHSLRH